MVAPDRTPLGRVAAAGVWGGAIAGGAAGAIDGLWSWRGLDQFAGGAGAKLAVLCYLAAIHAVTIGAVVGIAAIALALLGRATHLGAIARAAAAAHRDRPEAGLALVAVGVPAAGAALAVAYAIAFPALAGRKHIGLVIGVAMGVAIAGCLAAVIAAFVAARPVESLLARALRGRPLRARFARPAALVATAAVLALVCAGALVVYAWDTVRVLRIRWLWSALVIAALVWPSLAIGDRITARLATRPRWLRRAALPVAAVVALAVALAAGSSESVRKAAATYSGLGGGLTRLLSRMGDWDRDGYSRFLGGGDCNDLDASIHPGASERPGDGADNNCLGGDVDPSQPRPDPAFAPLPAQLPADFNVLLLTVDTLRADHVGAYGYRRPTTPAIDGVAAAGTLFVNAWAHAPSTRYSMPAILTGRHPLEVDYFDIAGQWPGIADSNTTIAEVLHGRGFTTAAIVNYWYFDEQRRMNQGFDHYDNSNKRLHKPVAGEGPARTSGTSSREQTDKALEFLDRHGSERFFLWVHYYDPHFEYQDHPGTHDFGRRPVDLYDHEIRFTDDQIARVIADLRRRGLYDRTVIVITGDHGEGFGEHGIELHGYHLYAAQTRVPLIVRVPGVAPRRAQTPAAHADILPTLANLAGAAPSPDVRGRSLVDAIAGRDTDRVVYQQLSYENDNEQRGAASDSCHVIYTASPTTSWQVYRIDRDPGETRDVADTGECADTRRALERWYDASEIPPGAIEALLRDAPEVRRRVDVDLGDAVRLVGVDLPREPVRPGQTFDVVYTWQARGSPSPEWKVFAHFESATGGRFQGDHKPVRPFDWWRAGDHVRYRQTVTIPRNARPGDYTMWSGLFRGGERISARSRAVPVRDDRAAVGQLKVAP